MTQNLIHKEDFSFEVWNGSSIYTLLNSLGGFTISENEQGSFDTRFQDHEGFVWIAHDFDPHDLMPDTPENIIAEIKAVGTKVR